MNETTFNKELTKIAPDLRLIFNHERRRWGIYQVRASHIITLQATGAVKPWLLFLLEDDKGDFRLPDQRDLQRVVGSVASAHKLWSRGGDWYANRIESQEQARLDKSKADQEDLFGQAAKEAVYHTNVLRNRGTRKVAR